MRSAAWRLCLSFLPLPAPAEGRGFGDHPEAANSELTARPGQPLMLKLEPPGMGLLLLLALLLVAMGTVFLLAALGL
jgi:hypothetical protein